jgi:hypothetical protein
VEQRSGEGEKQRARGGHESMFHAVLLYKGCRELKRDTEDTKADSGSPERPMKTR